MLYFLHVNINKTWGTCKVRNEIETKRNKTIPHCRRGTCKVRNEIETKRKETERNETKPIETKRNEM